MAKERSIVLRLPDDLDYAARAHAVAHNTTISAVVREALRAWVLPAKGNEWIVDASGVYPSREEQERYRRTFRTQQPCEPPEPDQVARARAWVKACCRPAKEKWHRGSYGMKHDAERWHRERYDGEAYISNGALITAMIEAGYSPLLDDAGTPNCDFHVRVVTPAEESPFGLYLEKARPRPGPEKDFIEDARGDLSSGKFPERLTSWAELESYLYTRNASAVAIAAGKKVWRNYQKARAK